MKPMQSLATIQIVYFHVSACWWGTRYRTATYLSLVFHTIFLRERYVHCFEYKYLQEISTPVSYCTVCLYQPETQMASSRAAKIC
jgi:hypothetical protein